MKSFRQFFARVRNAGVRRSAAVKTVAMGRERVFDAFDVGQDTFIFERGIARNLDGRPSVLIVRKGDLRRGAKGRVMTVTTGNHAVAAIPLLDGRFWKLSSLPPERRSETLMLRILCANIVNDVLEVSQREIGTADVVAADQWLLDEVGFGMRDVVMLERNDLTLDYYRRRGQEWRVKPLVWTESEMRTALAASRKRIFSKLSYYHSSRGVHLLSYAEFSRFAALASENFEEFVRGLKEIAGVFEGNTVSFARMLKHRGHHEIEFFGVKRGMALERLVPEIEKLLEAIELGRVGQLGVVQRINEIVRLYASLLSDPELADDGTKRFTETLYMYVTGEIYAVQGEGSTVAFDDRRTALPGATFVDGRPEMHAGADERTEVLMSNIRGMMSKDELIEYANVYELRGQEDRDCPLGRGATREIVYKTSRRPLESSLVEKTLSRSRKGYSSYMLARVGAMRALGIVLSDYYRLLKRRAGTGKGKTLDYYIRRRCEGEPMEAIPANYFRGEDGTSESKKFVLALSMLMGDAAAQNMAMKKFDPVTSSPLFGVGKEIYNFEYDLIHECVVPKAVATCSIRGSFGWPDLSFTEENLEKMAHFYLAHFVEAVRKYSAAHKSATLQEIAEKFMDGFEFRTRTMCWQLSVMRDDFEAFNPDIPKCFDFAGKWRFVLWSLERQERRLPLIRKTFLEKTIQQSEQS